MQAVVVVLVLLIAGVPILQYLRGARAKAGATGELAPACLADPLNLLIAQNPRKARLLAAAGGLIGIAIVVLVAYWLSQVPWQLDRGSPFTTSSSGTCGSDGAHYFIKVNGGSYLCGGGDSKCPEQTSIEVAYEAGNPNHCRVRSNVDRPSQYELQALLFALAWIFFAATVACWNGIDDVYPGSAPPLLEQTRAYRACAGILLLLLAMLGSSSWLYP